MGVSYPIPECHSKVRGYAPTDVIYRMRGEPDVKQWFRRNNESSLCWCGQDAVRFEVFPPKALRMVVEELLRPYMSEINSYTELKSVLDEVSEKSKTGKLWVDNLIKPVFLIMQYIRAEREGDWPLHLDVVSKMLPYFFAAGHHNYARYVTYYLNCMKNLPFPILERM